MEKVILKYQNMLKALNSLEQAIALYQAPHPEKFHLSLGDSMIQRFEYNIDLFWKFIKLFLQEHQKVIIEASSPRAIIREAAQAGIIFPNEKDELLKAVENRNLTSHVYNENVALEIIEYIPKAQKILQKIMDRIEF